MTYDPVAIKKWRGNNRVKYNAVMRTYRSTKRGWAASALCESRKRAKKKNLQNTLTTEYIESLIPANGLCPALGVELTFGGVCSPNSASLDRIIPKLGYVVGNVAVISHRANTIKNNASRADLVAIVNWLDLITTKE
jgi:hypothetical protein